MSLLASERATGNVTHNSNFNVTIHVTSFAAYEMYVVFILKLCMKFLCTGFMELVSFFYHLAMPPFILLVSLYYRLHLLTIIGTAFLKVLVFACTLIWNFCSKMLKKFPGESNNAKLFYIF